MSTNTNKAASELIAQALAPMMQEWNVTQARLGKTEGQLELVAKQLAETNATIKAMATETNEAIRDLAHQMDRRTSAISDKFDERTTALGAPRYPLIVSLVVLIFLVAGSYMRGPLNDIERNKSMVEKLSDSQIEQLKLPQHEGATGAIQRIDKDIISLEHRMEKEIKASHIDLADSQKENSDDIDVIRGDLVDAKMKMSDRIARIETIVNMIHPETTKKN